MRWSWPVLVFVGVLSVGAGFLTAMADAPMWMTCVTVIAAGLSV